MIPVYIAAPFVTRDATKEHLLRPMTAMGLAPRAGWLNGTRALTSGALGACPDSTDETVRSHATGDLVDLANCHAMLHLTANYCVSELGFRDGPDLHTGGRHTELGYALARSIPVVVLGEPENVFQRSLTTVVPTLEKALSALLEATKPTAPRYPTAEVKLSEGGLRDREAAVYGVMGATIAAGAPVEDVQLVEQELDGALTNSEFVTVASRWVTVS